MNYYIHNDLQSIWKRIEKSSYVDYKDTLFSWLKLMEDGEMLEITSEKYPLVINSERLSDEERDEDEESKVEPPKPQIQVAPEVKKLKELFPVRLTLTEKVKYDEYIFKYTEKLYKIYKRLNVKIVSKEVLKSEFNINKHLLQILDSISGNFNKISNQIAQLL